jgi:hypothetical protein
MKGVVDWSDELCVIIVFPDARAERLQRRLDQLRRFDNWLQGLAPWQQQLLPVPFALVIGCLAAWVEYPSTTRGPGSISAAVLARSVEFFDYQVNVVLCFGPSIGKESVFENVPSNWVAHPCKRIGVGPSASDRGSRRWRLR